MVSIGVIGIDCEFEEVLNVNSSCVVIVSKFNVIKVPISLSLYASSIDLGDPEHANNDPIGEQLN